MAYRQYTHCASISSFVGFQWVQYVMVGGTAVAAAAVAFLMAAPFVPGLMIVALSAVIAYCLWWLYDRLICLGGDVCAVGFVLTVETPDEKSGLDSFDTDYSLNLVLPPGGVGTTQVEAESSLLLGTLVKETSEVANYSFAGYSLPFQGDLVTHFSNGDPYGGQYTTACLHAEFEGGGVYDLLQSCEAALVFAIAAAVTCSIPIIGWIACLILSIAAGVITLAGIVNALNDKGNPADVNPHLMPIHSAAAPDGEGADILALKGTWVYDSAHEGWNEIHPIKQCQKVGRMIGQAWKEIQVGDDPKDVLTIGDVGAYIDLWCKMLDSANDPGTVTNQGLPQNQWVIHPLVDGCEPTPPPPR